MWKSRLSVLVIAVAVFAMACGTELSRDEAVAVLVQGGASIAEATCMADSLLALGRLDAANPMRSLDDDDRDLMVSVSQRCASIGGDESLADVRVLEGIGASGSQVAGGVIGDPDAHDEDLMAEEPALEEYVDIGEARDRAVATLVMLGRSGEFARCVVDYLLAIDAPEVLVESQFGLGLSPLEANAYAACS